jgi:hypothetical protein
MQKILAAIAMALVAGGAAAQSVDFTEPKNGALVSSPFKVKFAVTGMEVKPAGSMDNNTGHHHLIINGDGVKVGESIPFDEKHLHFGKGQTETEVTLPPGTYKLTMQFANGAHQSYGPGLARSITVTVK